MTTNTMTPELLNYAKKIVAERGIAKADMTKELMGDVLKEAICRMDRAMTRYMESAEAQGCMALNVYHNVSVAA
jgi:hypothetical protein